MAYLVLVRHGQSEWNAKGLWTGQRDVSLSDQGRQEARDAAGSLRDITIHKAHTSRLSRAQETLREIQAELEYVNLDTIAHDALNERDYGDYTAKNKWEIAEQLGEEAFTKLRRNWDHPVPNGETLKDVHARVVPYYRQEILPDLQAGRNVIISAHGNSLRALMKHLDDVADEAVHTVEIGTGQVVVYNIDADGQVVSKEVRTEGGKA